MSSELTQAIANIRELIDGDKDEFFIANYDDDLRILLSAAEASRWVPVTPETMPAVGEWVEIWTPATEHMPARADHARLTGVGKWNNDNWHWDIPVEWASHWRKVVGPGAEGG